MKIMIATPEATPYIKTGGLADVTGSLLKEYRGMKQEAYLIMPFYKKVKEKGIPLKDTRVRLRIPVGNRSYEGRLYTDKSSVYFIRCDEFFDRDELYGTAQGDYDDNASRFIFFSRAVLETCRVFHFKPDIIHCNEWQTGLIPLYLKTLYRSNKVFKNTATVVTIHNLGYQGLFRASEMPFTGLGWSLFNPEGVEFYGKINFLKAGLISADVLTTVSTTYSKEILKKEFGFGLDGVLQKREKDLYGVINGIDYKEWNPSTDKALPKNFNRTNLQGKKTCKHELVREVSLDDYKRPLIGMVSRLSAQKGLDILLHALDDLIALGINLVLLGKGDESFQRSFLKIAKRYKRRVSVIIGFDEPLARRIYAGSDFFLMPSRYEPCGLGQLIAMKYGSIPIGKKTGGLADTIHDFNPLTSTGTGFLFSDYTPSSLMDAIKRALCVYTDRDKLKKMQQHAMEMDFSWKSSAQRYIKLYTYAMKKKRGTA